jgi:hypothetical protein
VDARHKAGHGRTIKVPWVHHLFQPQQKLSGGIRYIADVCGPLSPERRARVNVSATYSIFFQQYWHPEEEVYRGPDGHYYRINDNR